MSLAEKIAENVEFGGGNLPYQIFNIRSQPEKKFTRKRGMSLTIDPASMKRFAGGMDAARRKVFGAGVLAIVTAAALMMEKAAKLAPKGKSLELSKSGAAVLWDSELIAATGEFANKEGAFKLRPKQQIIASVSFNANHAAPVHEKQDKFLQKAMNRTSRKLRDLIKANIDSALSGGVK